MYFWSLLFKQDKTLPHYITFILKWICNTGLLTKDETLIATQHSGILTVIFVNDVPNKFGKERRLNSEPRRKSSP